MLKMYDSTLSMFAGKRMSKPLLLGKKVISNISRGNGSEAAMQRSFE